MSFSLVPFRARIKDPRKEPSVLHSKSIIHSCQHQNRKPKNSMRKFWKRSKTHLINPLIVVPKEVPNSGNNKNPIFEKKNAFPLEGCQQMLVLCGIGYFVNGFRCFPWLGLNFHMGTSLRLDPSILQLVQNSGNLPMVAKPLYGILSDALSIGGDHRIPWISIGVFLQVLAWVPLAIIPAASKALPALMACVLLSNLGASISEVGEDALVAEYGQKNQISAPQSYALMTSAAGGILGNLIGGFFLLQTQDPKSLFFAYGALLAIQLTLTLPTREESLGLHQHPNDARKPILESVKEQYSTLMMVIRDERISSVLLWIVASLVIVPTLSGSVFCYQTQCLNLAPSVIGMSKVTGQLMLLSLTVMYDRFWKHTSMRKLIGTVQIIYALSLLLDLALVNQVNLKLGIPNEGFALCFAGLAETIAQFKLLPFLVFFASLAPPGCEGSLVSFLASTLCLSSIVSSFLGVGLASVLGITTHNYSSLSLGIMIQSLAALLPMAMINLVPTVQSSTEKKHEYRTHRWSKRRVSKLAFDPMYSYRRGKESNMWG